MKSIATVFLLLILSFGCSPAEQSAKGFKLPDGDATAGQVAFEQHRCNECHAIHGNLDATMPELELVVLGGPVTRIRNYGDLVTSIINPSHKISRRVPPSKVIEDGRSIMEFANVNDRLSVTELIDLVAYLQIQYKVVPPEIRPYQHVYP